MRGGGGVANKLKKSSNDFEYHCIVMIFYEICRYHYKVVNSWPTGDNVKLKICSLKSVCTWRLNLL